MYSNEVEGVNAENIKDKNVLLVDDSILSGRTLKKAISFLESSGSKSIIPIALCRNDGMFGKNNKDIPNLTVYSTCPETHIINPWGYCS